MKKVVGAGDLGDVDRSFGCALALVPGHVHAHGVCRRVISYEIENRCVHAHASFFFAFSAYSKAIVTSYDLSVKWRSWMGELRIGSNRGFSLNDLIYRASK